MVQLWCDALLDWRYSHIAQTYSTSWKFCSCFLLHKHCWRTVSGVYTSVRYWSVYICSIWSYRSIQRTILWHYEAMVYIELRG